MLGTFYLNFNQGTEPVNRTECTLKTIDRWAGNYRCKGSEFPDPKSEECQNDLSHVTQGIQAIGILVCLNGYCFGY